MAKQHLSDGRLPNALHGQIKLTRFIAICEWSAITLLSTTREKFYQDCMAVTVIIIYFFFVHILFLID